ncbi:hypothetical protein ENTCAN_05756 [Enterobacter cancerogenus ATCC 35316]|nr:hypothetical protein ENTCAN_05756 [Enterobacter cancerogenus ATCC 35316]
MDRTGGFFFHPPLACRQKRGILLLSLQRKCKRVMTLYFLSTSA